MFIGFVLGVVGGVLWVYQLDDLPGLLWAVLALIVGLWLIRRYTSSFIHHVIVGIIIGTILASLFGFLRPTLPKNFWGNSIWVEGEVASFVETRTSTRPSLRFDIQVARISLDGEVWQASESARLRLSCYQCDPAPRPGEVWRWPVKVQPIHAMFNPAGLDYEAWAYQNGLDGRGYVVKPERAQRLSQGWNLHTTRQDFAQRLQVLWQDSPYRAFYQALLYGEKSALTQQDWQILRQTATIHLMAISGLHLALIAWMSYGLGRLIWRLPLALFRQWPEVWVGGAVACVMVTWYAMMAGWTIPTQRAWIMVMVGLMFIVIRRKFQPWSALAIAALLILSFAPSSVLSPGFWLSFLAVALIFIMMSFATMKRLPAWQQAVLIQVGLSIGLLPNLWFFYQEWPIYGVLANLIAVPFVSFIALPLVILQAVAGWLVPDVAVWLVTLSDGLWHGFWWGMEYIASWPHAVIAMPPISGYQVLGFYLALFAFVAFNQAWLKALSLIVMGVLLWPWSFGEPIAPNHFRLTVLDVGQGQTLVFETRHHVLVYDAGPAWGTQTDAAHLAILPYLQSRAHKQLDMLMISHADQDHAGGAATLVENSVIKQKLTGQVARLGLDGFSACEAGQSWHWDGVKFEVLHPGAWPWPVQQHNDYSCVLRVSAGEHAVMVSGDLSATLERRLVQAYSAEALRSDILIAGHHGSQHSSDVVWLQALQPGLVIFSSGYANRFGFPKPSVIQRVEAQGADWLNTACEGAIQLEVAATGWRVLSRLRRDQGRWYHHQCAP